ncbi:hypothetical protein BGZ99_006881 [Dissophora globulifera]|uniref:Transcription elongation factor 1 homolog n=1 Tax=Dissophora globulifera TaxID=979702 RepID=A0A9P6UZE7_9FUNG|nr:hypothetical protein BGZ99_006881 [Dissophora globulifera]
MTRTNAGNVRRLLRQRSRRSSMLQTATVFDCLACGLEKVVICKLNYDQMVGSLNCEVCFATYACNINHLETKVDVYHKWLDACEELNPDGRGRLRLPATPERTQQRQQQRHDQQRQQSHPRTQRPTLVSTGELKVDQTPSDTATALIPLRRASRASDPVPKVQHSSYTCQPRPTTLSSPPRDRDAPGAAARLGSRLQR